MAFAKFAGDERATIFCLHYLGGSAREWARVAARLAPTARVVALDLPGFGDAAQVPGYRVAEMAVTIADEVRASAPGRWMIVGHSMGAKVAAVLARNAEDGAAGLDGLAGIALLAGSPPSPEPMSDEQRETMLGWFAGSPESNRQNARDYVTANTHAPLDDDANERAVEDALRANRAAWVSWLTTGSREDWAARVGVLRTPTLLVSGTDDENLGPRAQRDLMAPHFARVRSIELANTRHLLPLERPDDVARLLDEHLASLDDTRSRTTAIGAAYRALLDSTRVSRQTRDVLTERGRLDDPAYEPVVLDRVELATLRALLARIVPQTHRPPIDLAARIDAQLGTRVGDGWRFAALPPDAQAYRGALDTIRGETHARFARELADVDDQACDVLLTRIADGELGPEMQAWFEDLRADAVRLYMAHPATLARIGYSGIANGGDGEPKSGFARVGLGEREAWEPHPGGDATA